MWGTDGPERPGKITGLELQDDTAGVAEVFSIHAFKARTEVIELRHADCEVLGGVVIEAAAESINEAVAGSEISETRGAGADVSAAEQCVNERSRFVGREAKGGTKGVGVELNVNSGLRLVGAREVGRNAE